MDDLYPASCGGQGRPVATLDDLAPDAFAAVCQSLQRADVAALGATSAALRHAVASNDRLWASLYCRQFSEPWQRLTQKRQQHQQHGSSQQQHQGAGVLPGGWRDMYLRTHTACQQLRSTGPACREWTTDASAVHLASIHGAGAGPRRLTLSAQGSTVELRCAPPSAKSFQLYGHSARVSCAAVLLAPAGGGGGGGAVQRVGVVTGSHDQTLRLWSGNVDPESYEFRAMPLSLLTPLRTLRGHQESVTCLQLVAGSTGVTIAATGGKDRTVRLWGLAPLVPSPVHKPQIATLRGHGAPITCLAMAGGGCGGGGSSEPAGDSCDGGGSSSSTGAAATGGSWLVSGGLDARVKCWDVWSGSAACTGTVRVAAPVAAMQPAGGGDTPLAPHTLLVSGGSGVQLVDLRCMRVVGGVALSQAAAPAGERADGGGGTSSGAAGVHCFCQWGHDLAVGSSDCARVFDLRMLSSAAAAGGSSSGGSGSSGGRICPERLRLTGHARPVTSIHVDRLKVVTATDRYGEAPVRVWCANSGDCLAELDSCLPEAATAATASGAPGTATLARPAGGTLDNGGGGGDGSEEEEQQAGAAAALGMAAPGEQQGQGGSTAATAAAPGGRGPGRQRYNRGWEGVTALACRGALLVSGNSEGAVCERDFSCGGLPEAEHGGGGSSGSAAADGLLAGRFWQHSSLDG